MAPAVVRLRRRQRHVLALVLCGLVAVGACSGESRQSTPTRLPADVVRAIEDSFESRGVDRVRAVLVLHDGVTVLADYRGTTPEETWDVESVTKSVLSMLVGRAIGDGLISLDQTLGELLPEHVDAMARWQRRVTLRDLLTHSAGFSADTDATLAVMAEPNPVDRILGRGHRPRDPEFAYSNEGSQIIATILRTATGVSLLDYARTSLFNPLDISTTPVWEDAVRTDEAAAETFTAWMEAGFAWPVASDGTHLGWGLMKLTPADMAKLGELMLSGGTWAGDRLLPGSWTAASTRRQVAIGGGSNSGLSGYGYHWWVTTAGSHPAYLAYGYGGQSIEVVPALDLVVVTVRELDYGHPDEDEVEPGVIADVVTDVIAPQFE